ncbi:hypothetical protein LOD99_14008 [Oopsacas minuta]|uniref:Uncharacterized protein n=1 Tax=Oopsacas minuta TaxID=111878 RepID=A0AAV7KGF4_9METZ|nr:hypothetical protein LOD99_14008 [Oopsacas minuta]
MYRTFSGEEPEFAELLSVYEKSKLQQQSAVSKLDQSVILASEIPLKLDNLCAELESNGSSVKSDKKIISTDPIDWDKIISEKKMLDQKLKNLPQFSKELRLIEEYQKSSINAYDK